MKVFFFTLLLCFSQANVYAQSTTTLKNFIQDAVDTKLSSVSMADKYFCTTQLQRADQDGEQTRKVFDDWLSKQRKDLREKQLNLAEVRISPYDSLTATERPAKPFHMMEETSHTYVALYHGKIICFFLLQGDKISSTLLLGMGRENNFVDFCK